MIPKRILFIAEGGLGDQVTLTPALREVRASFPDSFISVFITYRHPPDPSKRDPFAVLSPSQIEWDNILFTTNKNVNETYVLDRYALKSQHGIARLTAEIAVVRFLRKKKFDTVICTFPHQDRYVVWSFVSGATMRVGARNQALHWLLTHTPDIDRPKGGAVEYCCDLVRAIGATIRSTRIEYAIPESSIRWADNLLQHLKLDSSRNLVAIHPGGTAPFKIWPPDRYAALINHVVTKLNATVLLLKGGMDSDVVYAIRKNLKTEIIEVDCSSGVGNLAAILKRCSLCISNDSGPRHLAVAVGTPSVAFFRLFHDKEWDIYHEIETCVSLKSSGLCPACTPERCFDRVPAGEQFGCQCLRMISVEEVIRYVERLLKPDSATTRSA